MEIEFIHIPKCAGTSIRKAIKTKTTGHRAIREGGIQADFTFTFIRNPFDRLASLYRHMWRGNIAGVKDLNWSFKEWFDKTVKGDEAERWNPKYWKPCYWWLSTEDGTIPVDFIGRVEQIDYDWKRLCTKLNKKVELGRHNSSITRNQQYTASMQTIMYHRYEDDFRLWYPNF